MLEKIDFSLQIIHFKISLGIIRNETLPGATENQQLCL